MMKKIEFDRYRCAVTFATVITALVPAGSAAAPVSDHTSIFGAATFQCADEASRLLNRQLLRMAPDQILDGMRRALNRGSDWSRGNQQYEKARKLIVDALTAEENERGPLFNFSADKVLAQVTSRWNADEKRYYTTFFSKSSGRLYLTDILDGATCKGWLESLNQPPFPEMDSEDKARWDRLIGNLNGGEARFLGKLRGLSKDERQSFDAGYKRIGLAFVSAPMTVATQHDSELKKRLERAIASRMPQILEVGNVD